MENDNKKEVYFHEYCNKCKFEKLKEEEEPCNECLHVPAREYSHKPEKFIERDEIKKKKEVLLKEATNSKKK